MEISFAKSESGKDSFCFWFELPSAMLIKNVERSVIRRFGTGISDPGYSCFVVLDDFLRLHKFGRNSESKFEYGFVSGRSGFLRKKPDSCILFDRNRPGIGRRLPEQKRKQS